MLYVPFAVSILVLMYDVCWCLRCRHCCCCTMYVGVCWCLRRFLKAKLAACQTQLEEALVAHQNDRQETVELRRQVSALLHGVE